MSVSSTQLAVVLVQEPAHPDLCLYFRACRVLKKRRVHFLNTADLLFHTLDEQAFIPVRADCGAGTYAGFNVEALREFAGVYGLAFWQVQQLTLNTANLGLRHWLCAIYWSPHAAQLAMRAPISPRKTRVPDCVNGRL